MSHNQQTLRTPTKKYAFVPSGTTIIRKRDAKPSERGLHTKQAKNHPWRSRWTRSNESMERAKQSGFVERT